jgi:probable F420-dependent oxidoreductase
MVRIGIHVEPQHAKYDAMRRCWLEAEALGVDVIYTWDHFFPLSGDPDGLHYEALATLASLAEVTSRAQVGALVICNSYRNPNLLADAHRTIDHISDGRVVLGIGAGWAERDYETYGYEFGTAAERLKAFRRDLPVLRHRLSVLNPPPIGPMPLLIGGGGEKVTLRLVAEHADVWHSFGDVELYRHKADVLAGHCAAIGRDPADIRHSWQPSSGSLLEQADGLIEAGVSELTVSTSGPDYDLSELRDVLAWRDRVNG